MWPVFADPKTDFVFKRIFGTEPNEHLPIELLDALLELSGEQRIADQARTAGFTSAEWDAYDRAKVAEQDARGAISLAERQGEARGDARGFARGHEHGLTEGRTQGLAEGFTEGLRRSIEDICELLAIPLDPSRRAEIGTMPREQLEALLARLKRERRWE